MIPSICAMKSNDEHNLLFAYPVFYPTSQFDCHSNTLRLLFKNTHLSFWIIGCNNKKIHTRFSLGFIINRFVILWMKPALNNSHFKNHKWVHPDKRVPAAYTVQCMGMNVCVSACLGIYTIFNGSPFLIL